MSNILLHQNLSLNQVHYKKDKGKLYPIILIFKKLGFI